MAKKTIYDFGTIGTSSTTLDTITTSTNSYWTAQPLTNSTSPLTFEHLNRRMVEIDTASATTITLPAVPAYYTLKWGELSPAPDMPPPTPEPAWDPTPQEPPGGWDHDPGEVHLGAPECPFALYGEDAIERYDRNDGGSSYTIHLKGGGVVEITDLEIHNLPREGIKSAILNLLIDKWNEQYGAPTYALA